ncbi:hypothetical protein WB403_20135 [Streptomyces brasiliscabiei]|uniref:Secreted protein n=3 Tax=Streptomyces brasiliscabiei TaxID=2736302 RepID=A0ABU8GGD9_9ACTN
MSIAMLVAGLVFMAVGLVVFLWPPPKPDPNAPRTHGLVGDAAKIIEEFNKLLDRLDKRYRPGLVLLFVGLALASMGVYLEASDAKEAVKASPVAAVRAR